jgi:hypothetical protein
MVAKTKRTLLNLDDIRIDGGTQPRAAIDEDTVEDYAEEYRANSDMPPLDVFFDGVAYWLADGFHRWHAARKADLVKIKCQIHKGTCRDAILFSVRANAEHGKRRTNADKRRAVEILLVDGEWSKWSDRVIANRCAVTHPFVASVRSELVTDSSCNGNGERLGRDGKKRKAKAQPAKPEDHSGPCTDAEAEDFTGEYRAGRGIREVTLDVPKDAKTVLRLLLAKGQDDRWRSGFSIERQYRLRKDVPGLVTENPCEEIDDDEGYESLGEAVLDAADRAAGWLEENSSEDDERAQAAIDSVDAFRHELQGDTDSVSESIFDDANSSDAEDDEAPPEPPQNTRKELHEHLAQFWKFHPDITGPVRADFLEEEAAQERFK